MTLTADVRVQVDDFRLAIALEAEPGETVAVLGPNGAGKSTLLRCLAGLSSLDAGRIELDGRTLDDPASRTFVPPQARSIGFVFQDHLLFPSMNVTDNVAFGLRCRGVARPEARRRARALLDAVGLTESARDRPSDLSGGESQRVALARALAIEPKLLLLDEPLSSLDVTTRSQVRRELGHRLERLDGCVRVLVSHDPVDAYALADRVVIVESGTMSQSGALAEVAARPRSRYVADLVGVNLYEGVGDMMQVTLAGGHRLIPDEAVSGPVYVVIHPRSVALHRTEPSGSPRNVWRAAIADIDLERDRARVRTTGPIDITAEITSAAATELSFRPGDEVWVSVKASETTTHPR